MVRIFLIVLCRNWTLITLIFFFFTVPLPELPISHTDYGGFQPSTTSFMKGSPSGTGSSLTELNAPSAMPSQRCDPNYYNWSTNTYNYNNYQYNNINNNPACLQSHPPYINTNPQMILPNLYSTVNQNQIHVHLHSSSGDKHNVDTPCFPGEIKISDIDGAISITTELQSSETGGLVQTCETNDEGKHGLYGAGNQEVWRPYWHFILPYTKNIPLYILWYNLFYALLIIYI